ncbi:putative DNA-binding domain-containing protein [Bdellovibrio sp. HCB209]|uniref:HvfC/BufC family peptide modification chaperone n=1 Tax=Bdellovibrio sp. HCB209 TaxID=3394354 RepID=UPI0039B38EF2
MASNLSLKARQESFQKMITQDSPENLRESIYSYAYRIRFEESLKEDFPVAISLDTDFSKRFEIFCRSYGSQSWSMNHLAQRWADFLKNQKQENLEPWLRDLYKLEALNFQSYFLNQNSPLYIGRIDLGEEISLIQSRPFLVLESEWDVESIWRTETPPKTTRKSLILFYNDEDGNTFVTLDPASTEIISHIFKEKSWENLPKHLQFEETVRTAFSYLSPLFQIS